MDKKELMMLLSEGEGFNIEFKESLSDSIAKDICAFANANGGKILLGIRDSGEIKGIRITNRLRSQIQDYARNIAPHITLHMESTGCIIVINVPEGKSKPYSAKGKFYMRQGANSQQLDRDEVRDLFKEEGFLRFDEIPNKEFKIKNDLMLPKFNNFLKKAGISPVAPKGQILQALLLLENNRMKNAGVLLFCDNVIRFFRTAFISCLVYQGKEKYKILDKQEFGSDIALNLENALKYLKEKLNTEYIIRTMGPRVEKLELPEEALREALVNAIAHRDYFFNSAHTG